MNRKWKQFMQLCGQRKRSDVTDHGFRGSTVICLKCTLRQAVDANDPKNPQTKYITTGFPHSWEFLLGYCFYFFLIIGYTLAELGVQCNLVIGNHKTLPCFLKRQQRTHQRTLKVAIKWSWCGDFWIIGEVLVPSTKISLALHFIYIYMNFW